MYQTSSKHSATFKSTILSKNEKPDRENEKNLE